MSIAVGLAVVQQIPPVRDSGYETFRYLILSLFGTLIFFNLRCCVDLLRKGLVLRMALGAAVSAVVVVAAMILFGASGGHALPMDLLMPIGVMVLSAAIPYGDRLGPFLRFYVLLTVVMAIWTVIVDNGGFVVADAYLIQSKNQIGPMVGGAAVVCLHRLLEGRRQGPWHWLGSVMTSLALIGLLASLMVIRNRSGIVALLIVFVVYALRFIFGRRGTRRWPQVLLWGGSLFVLSLFGYLQAFWNMAVSAFVANKDATDVDSLSSGRVGLNAEAMGVIFESPLLGQLSSQLELHQTVHNYFLNVLVSIGLVGGAPILGVYFLLWGLAVRNSVGMPVDPPSKGSGHPLQVLSGTLLLFALVVSLFEYAAPFGPGTAMLLTWFLLGQWIGLGHDSHRKLATR